MIAALVKDNDNRKTAAFTVFLEFLQLMAFAFVGPFGNIGETTHKVLLWTQIENRLIQYNIHERMFLDSRLQNPNFSQCLAKNLLC